MEQKQRFPKNVLDLYMINSIEKEVHITSFDMIRPNSDADISKEACLSLLEWANYLLEPYADIDNNDDSKLDNVNDLKRPMLSYKITDDEINWKKETETNTTVTEAGASAPEEELLWTKYDWNVMNKSNTALRSNIAEALEVSHSRYGKLKRLTNAQQDEKDILELGMLSIIQMHCNETNTTDEKNWKDNFNDIKAFYHEELKSNQVIDNDVIDIPQETYKEAAPTDATDEIRVDDNIDDSDDDESIRHQRNHTKRYNLFDDDDNDDALEAQNTPDKRSGDEEIAGIDRYDTAATDKEKTDYVPAKAIKSEAANNKDVDNPEQQKEAQQETGGEVIIGIDSNDTTATGNDIKSDAAGNKKEAQTRSWG